jgi:AhpD family alkylhydroperoxidase
VAYLKLLLIVATVLMSLTTPSFPVMTPEAWVPACGARLPVPQRARTAGGQRHHHARRRARDDGRFGEGIPPPTGTRANYGDTPASDIRGQIMMIDWNAYQAQVLAGVGELGRASGGTVRGYRELSDAGTKTAVLDPKTRELIALAVAVTRQCDGCITIHTDAAIKQGATKEEIVEALGVAIAVNAGAALVYSTRVLDAYNTKIGAT